MGPGLVWAGEENLPPPGFNPWIIEPPASRYTDYAIPVPATRPSSKIWYEQIISISYMKHCKSTITKLLTNLYSKGLVITDSYAVNSHKKDDDDDDDDVDDDDEWRQQ